MIRTALAFALVFALSAGNALASDMFVGPREAHEFNTAADAAKAPDVPVPGVQGARACSATLDSAGFPMNKPAIVSLSNGRFAKVYFGAAGAEQQKAALTSPDKNAHCRQYCVVGIPCVTNPLIATFSFAPAAIDAVTRHTETPAPAR